MALKVRQRRSIECHPLDGHPAPTRSLIADYSVVVHQARSGRMSHKVNDLEGWVLALIVQQGDERVPNLVRRACSNGIVARRPSYSVATTDPSIGRRPSQVDLWLKPIALARILVRGLVAREVEVGRHDE